MAYVTADEYSNTFHGSAIPSEMFDRIEGDAEDIIDGIVQLPVTDEDKATDRFKRAVCYQAELIYRCGGMEAIIDRANQGRVTNERLDDYSVSHDQNPGDSQMDNLPTLNGVPVSPMTVSILRNMGYLKRWVYSGGLPYA